MPEDGCQRQNDAGVVPSKVSLPPPSGIEAHLALHGTGQRQPEETSHAAKPTLLVRFCAFIPSGPFVRTIPEATATAS